MYIYKFGKNASAGSEVNARKRSNVDADAEADDDGIRTKNNMSPNHRVCGT